MINRSKYSYYPEAYLWFGIMLITYLVTDVMAFAVAGCVPGATMGLYYLYRLVDEKTAEAKRLLS